MSSDYRPFNADVDDDVCVRGEIEDKEERKGRGEGLLDWASEEDRGMGVHRLRCVVM